jgi:hypothetical protein
MVQTPGSKTLVLSADPACTSAGGDALTFTPAGGAASKQKHLLTFNPCLRLIPKNARGAATLAAPFAVLQQSICKALQWPTLPCPALLFAQLHTSPLSPTPYPLPPQARR